MSWKNKKKGRYVVFSFACLVFGFLLSFSYHLTKKTRELEPADLTNSQWAQNMELRNELIAQEEINRELEKELRETQDKIFRLEGELAEEKQVYFNLAEDAEKYRVFLGKVKVRGEGVKVTLADGQYNPKDDHVHNYIVHEHHVFQVINELYVAGASAVSVNGQRLRHNSYIVCNGPVIEVDGIPHPAPFVIEAIGDPDILSSALNLPGGVKDLLVNENIVFTLEKKDEIIMEPILNS